MTVRPGLMRASWSAMAVLAVLALPAPCAGMCVPGAGVAQARPERAVARTASIRAAVWGADNQLVTGAHLRLRNAATGHVRGEGVTDAMGQVLFVGIEAGAYAIELVSANGKVLVVGQRFSAAPGEVIATFVRLGAAVPWFNTFFSNAALAVATTAAAVGITAMAPGEQRPVSARK